MYLTSQSGEIDIIEGVNSATSNSMTLHTGPGCSINDNSFSGLIKTTNCYVDAAGQGNNVGCGIGASGSKTYGDPFNSAGGGVYATEWTNQSIAIYFFSRNAIPADITSGNPNPAGWGEPQALFEGSCNIEDSFKSHQIVFDTTFCGQWAGQQGVWSADPVCGSKAATCNAYVQNNPSAFAEAYWEVNSVKVYQNSGSFIGATPSAAPASTAPASSAHPAASAPPAASPAAPSVPALPSIVSVPVASVQVPSSPSVAPPAAAPAAPSAVAETPETPPAAPSEAPAAASAAAPTDGSLSLSIPFPSATGGGHRHHHHPEGPPADMMEVATTEVCLTSQSSRFLN
jgi:hypothetical protein